MWKRWIVASLMLATIFSVALAHAQPPEPQAVRVEVRGGRAWEGVIDTRSSDEHLVLRFEKGSAQLRRSIAWNEIQDVQLAGRRLTATELKRQADSLATPSRTFAQRGARSLSAPSPSDLPPTETLQNEMLSSSSSRVSSLAIDALLANWDADVEADGLMIQLQPLDDWQQLTAASGTLEVELYAIQARTFHHAPFSGGRSVEPIARWTQAVTASDFTSRGALIRFPFQAAHPEFDDTLGHYGLVHVKYSVPGSGVFERSIDGIRIRPWAPLRDYLQLDTGRRFLPHESTGRSKTAWPNAYP